jgi:HNH endonuclease
MPWEHVFVPEAPECREVRTRQLVAELLARGLASMEIARVLGHSISQCEAHFGFARQTFMDGAKRGDLVTRPHAAPIEIYLVKGRRTNRTHLKRRLLATGLKQNRCERCGIESWLGEPLSMALHHVNGDGLDNRLENLALLCPNCHAQTPNFSGRNRKIGRLTVAPAA